MMTEFRPCLSLCLALSVLMNAYVVDLNNCDCNHDLD